MLIPNPRSRVFLASELPGHAARFVSVGISGPLFPSKALAYRRSLHFNLASIWAVGLYCLLLARTCALQGRENWSIFPGDRNQTVWPPLSVASVALSSIALELARSS